jgi:hypothetical protein
MRAMPMIRIAIIIAIACVAGCGPQVNPWAMGPTGHFGDSAHLTPVTVRSQWKYDITALTQQVVTKQLRFPATAEFDYKIRYEAFYDSSKNITWLAVYGNVTCSSDVGQKDDNGYYVTWQQPGEAKEDVLPPWQLKDVEVLDQTY